MPRGVREGEEEGRLLAWAVSEEEEEEEEGAWVGAGTMVQPLREIAVPSSPPASPSASMPSTATSSSTAAAAAVAAATAVSGSFA